MLHNEGGNWKLSSLNIIRVKPILEPSPLWWNLELYFTWQYCVQLSMRNFLILYIVYKVLYTGDWSELCRAYSELCGFKFNIPVFLHKDVEFNQFT